MNNLLQIGTNTAGDDFFEICKNFKEVEHTVYLIEPNELHNKVIQKSYEGFNIKLLNCIISDTDGVLDMYFHEDMDERQQLASVNKEHFLKEQHNWDGRFSRVEGFYTKQYTSFTPNSLLQLHGLQELEVFYVDAEGHDETILKSIDYSTYNIKNIYYENLHLNNSSMISFLEEQGYVLQEEFYGENSWTTHVTKAL